MLLKITHIITTLDRGGAETMLAKLAGNLASRGGLEQHVICLGPEGRLVSELLQSGIGVTCLGMQKRIQDLLAIAKLFSILRRQKPDIVQTWLYHADMLGSLAALTLGIDRLAWNLRCSEMIFSESQTTKILVYLLARMSRLPKGIVSNSAAGRRHHQKLGYRPRMWKVIPNGFDTKRFCPNLKAGLAFRKQHGIALDSMVIGMLARFDQMKDYTTFFKAVAMISPRPKVKKFAVVCAGQGVDKSNKVLENIISDLGLTGNVHLLGYCAEPESFFQALDIHVLASKGEGFPNVVGEAMSCGVPCIASDVGDVKQLLGNHGKVFAPGDSHGLAAHLMNYIDLDRSARKKIGTDARQRIIDHFSIDRVADQYLEFYESLL